MPFISPKKLFSFSRYLSFRHFGHIAKRLDKKDKVNFKCYGITARLTNNCNKYIANISRSKDNQTMKFGQLMKCNMRNVFLEKSYTKCGG